LQSYATGEHLAFLESLPKLHGRVLVGEENVTIEVIVTGSLPSRGQLRCRVRRLADDHDGDYERLRQTKPGEFVLDRSRAGQGEFWYQLGISHPDAHFIIYEDWQRARVQ
jgi:hypothetical protein